MLLVTPIFLALIVLSILYVHTQRAAIRADADGIVREATRLIDNEIARDTLALKALSASTYLVGGDFANLYNVARKVADDIPGSSIAVRKPSGKTIFNTNFPFGPEPPKPQDNNLIAADQEALQKRSMAISDLFVGVTRKTFIALVEPVFENGEASFLLSLGIPTNAISNILNHGMNHSAWLISVTGTDNTILVRNWDEDRFVGKKASESFMKNTEGDDGVFLATSLDGVDVFDVYVRSKLTGWKIAAGLPLTMYEAPLHHTLYALTAIIVFGLTCSIAISFVYARYLLKRVNALQALVASSNVTNFKLLKSGVKEVDDLADALAESFMLLNDRDQHQQVLVKELNHRAKNALTAIQAIAYATQRNSKSLDAFVRTFESRLAAMARSYDIITRNDWRSSELKELILECCKPFADLERIKIDGPSVLLSPKALIGMGLVIHELATNAVKYGALSNTTGEIFITWQIVGGGKQEIVRFSWTEHGGPSVPKVARIRVSARN